MLKVGDVLGRYELVAHLKSGGMATLYLGRPITPDDNRIFAVKVVHPHFLDDNELVSMFRAEAGLSQRIKHPNVVHVEEVGADHGRHFLVMEYVHGCSVAQLLQALIRLGRRMSPELAVFIAMAVAEGLHAAHETRGDNGELLNVVHRDVSPQNILLSHTGDIRLIDFGVAKSRMRMNHSATGLSIKGKLRYMAPEHATGKAVDRRTDVYALAIVLWEMLTMRPLFWAKTDFDVLTLVRDPKVTPPSQYVPKVTSALDEAILKGLAKNIDDRPATALDFRNLLAKAVPFAEALDEEQVAELLHTVLGDKMKDDLQSLPDAVSRVMSGAELTEPGYKNLPAEVLETLTSPSKKAALLGESLAYNEPADGSADDQLPETTPPGTISIRPVDLSPDDIATEDHGTDLTDPEEPDEATELMSVDALREITGALESGVPIAEVTDSVRPAARNFDELSDAELAAFDDESPGQSYLPFLAAVVVGLCVLAGFAVFFFAN